MKKFLNIVKATLIAVISSSFFSSCMYPVYSGQQGGYSPQQQGGCGYQSGPQQIVQRGDPRSQYFDSRSHGGQYLGDGFYNRRDPRQQGGGYDQYGDPRRQTVHSGWADPFAPRGSQRLGIQASSNSRPLYLHSF